MTEQNLFDELIPKRRREEAGQNLFADLIPEQKTEQNLFASDIPERRQTTSRLGGDTPITLEGIKETPAAILRGAIKSIEAIANLLPGTMNLALQSPEGLSPYQDPQIPAIDVPKPAAPETEFGKTVELASEFGTPFLPLGKAAKAVAGMVKGPAPAAHKIAPELTAALASAAEQRAVYQRFLAKGAKEAAQKAPGTAVKPSIQASAEATQAADVLTPEFLALRNARRELPVKSEGFSVERLSADEAAKRTQLAILEAGKGFREARRSGRTFAEIKADASAVGMSADDLLARTKGSVFNDAQTTAARQIAIDEAATLEKAVKLLDPADPASLGIYKQMALRASAVFEQSSAAISEGARALGAVRIELAPQRARMKAVENITSGKFGVDPIEQLKMLQSLDDPVQVARFMRTIPEATTGDKFMEYWINSLLSGPVTHVKNTVSNSLVAAYSLPERAMSATFGAVSSGERVYFREVTAQAAGMAKAMKQATKNAWRTFVDEGSVASTGKIELRTRQAIKGTKGYLIRTPGRLLESSDVWFKTINYGGEAEALAVRRAIQEGKRGADVGTRATELLVNLPDDLAKQAWRRAEYNTFTNRLSDQEGIIAGAAEALQNFKAKHPSMGIIVPFVRTPTNIFKFSVARSPLGFALKDVRTQLTAGGASRQEALGRIALGTAVATTAGLYTANGHITGAGPSDANERRVWRMSGRQPYSVKVGDKWYAYGGLEPLGTLLGVAADFAEIGNKISAGEREKVASMIGIAFARNVKEKTFMQGISQVVGAVDSPDRKAEAMVQNLLGTAVPTGVAQTARALDPVVGDVRGIMDRILSRIPMASENVAPLLNFWGDEIKREGGGLSLFSPVYISTQKNDKVVDEMIRLGYSPRMPERTIAEVRLTPQQYNRFVRTAGQNAHRLMAEQVARDDWADVVSHGQVRKGISDAAKLGLFEMIVTDTRSVARNKLIFAADANGNPLDPVLKAAYLKQPKGSP